MPINNSGVYKPVKSKSRRYWETSLSFIFVVSFALAMFSSTAIKHMGAVVRENLMINNKYTMKLATLRTSESAMKYEDALSVLAKDQSFSLLLENGKDQTAEDILRLFKDYKDTYREIQSIYIGTADKSMYIYPQLELPADYDPTGRPWYLNSLERKAITWSEPYLDATTGEVIISLSIPIYKQNQSIGVLSVDLNYSAILKPLTEVVMGKDGFIVVTDKNGIVLLHPDKTKIGMPIDIPALRDLKHGDGGVMYEYNGRQKVAMYSRLDNLDINVIGITPNDYWTTGKDTLLRQLIMLSLLLIAYIAILILVNGRRLSGIFSAEEDKADKLQQALEALREYREKDIITEEEYERKRAAIIDDYKL